MPVRRARRGRASGQAVKSKSRARLRFLYFCFYEARASWKRTFWGGGGKKKKADGRRWKNWKKQKSRKITIIKYDAFRKLVEDKTKYNLARRGKQKTNDSDVVIAHERWLGTQLHLVLKSIQSSQLTRKNLYELRVFPSRDRKKNDNHDNEMILWEMTANEIIGSCTWQASFPPSGHPAHNLVLSISTR